MILYNQTEIVQALLNPRIYPISWHVSEVEMIQSHIAMLFLAGDYAFKLKRAVLSPGTDFSTPQKRRVACVREMRRSTVYAPHLVVGVRSVRRLPNGRICIGGKMGEEIDTLLIMRRLKKADILGSFLPCKTFDRFEVMDLAEQLADLHNKAKTFRSKWQYGDIEHIIAENERILIQFAESFIERHKIEELTTVSYRFLMQNASLIALRQKSGHIRKCHGELLLCNIARKENRYLFFSPVEYNETLDCIDTLYDLAYLLMDMEMRGMRRLANMLFNHYLAYTNDMSGYPLLPLYQSMRAASRAGVCAKKAILLDGEEKAEAERNACQYFDLALHFLKHNKPALIACGGLSGSGKSRVARELGGRLNPPPGAVILQEDVVKKQMAGCQLNEKLDSSFHTPAYEQVAYDVLRQQARMALSVGSCVIIDALFYSEKERKAVEALAQELNIPFVGIWIEAPLDVRAERVHSRIRNTSDIQEKSTLEMQMQLYTGQIDWNRINTDRSREDTINQVLDILEKNDIDVFVKNKNK